ncbi:MAG: MutS-related protein [Candidatus Saccharibacteria bacterium]
MEQELIDRYQTLTNLYQEKCDKQKLRLRLVSWIRLAFFLFLVASIVYLIPVSHTLGWIAVLAFMAGFLLLIKQSVSTERLLNYYQNLVQINQNEIKAIRHDLSPFNGGNEYIHPEHDYSYDLDLFGEDSFFQFLNRTVTVGGKNMLAGSIQNSKENQYTIQQKQEAVDELADCLEWRQQFLASGYQAENIRSADFILHQPQTIQLIYISFLKVTLILLPVITISLGVLWIMDVIPNQAFTFMVILQWGLFFLYSKTIGKFKKTYGLKSKLLNQYVDMLTLIEKKEFKSNYLVQLKSKLFSQGKSASELTSLLQKVLNELDYSQNLLVGFVLDSILLWDIRCVYRLNQWHNDYESNMTQWFDVIAQMDALISLANLNYNHPEWALPQIAEREGLLHAEDLGHPLIPKEKRIGNSFSLKEEERVVIITGANMAGKSTFLRTLGVNLILAAQGCRVCASSFSFTPMRLFTHMRTSDNLMKDESYFYAELLRLHHMLELLRQGENLFIIIDEMLKGTNSIDKLNGSVELLKQLIQYKIHCVVATHDLKLTELADQYPHVIKNQCFEVNLANNDLEFDYKLRDGVTSTMNATFLMRKMGIIP